MQFKFIRAFTTFLLATALGPIVNGAPLTNTVSQLMVELLTHPEQTVITAQNPAFGWSYQPFFRNDWESGYHLIVSTTAALAQAGTGDIWDSGWVAGSNSINVPYGGAALQPNKSYYWRVQPANSVNQKGSFSAVQQFNTASQLLNPLDMFGVIYQQPSGGSANCYPLQYFPASPAFITNTAPGVWFIDFGQDAFADATVHANGSFSGTTVTAGFGEMAANFVVNPAPPDLVRYGASTFSLQNGDVVYTVHPPNFAGRSINPPPALGSVIPYRYLELSNFPGTLNVTDVVQRRLSTEFNTNAATFNSSSPTLNQVWALCRNSMQWFGFDGIYVDGDRERLPYESDSFIHQLSSYAVNDDWTQVRCSFEFLANHPTWPTEWKTHMIMIAWADYLETGNTNLLVKYYDTLRQDSFTWAATGNGLMKSWPNFPFSTNSDVIDWPTTDRDGFVLTSGTYTNWTNSVINAFYYHGLQLMANIANVIGRTNDAATLNADASQVYSAYNATFWNSSAQHYVDGVGTAHASAHANFFPLAFGLVPPANQAAVVNYIHSRMAVNDGMPPSVYGVQYMLDALFNAGDATTAVGLLATNGPRSWMNMINIGSTLTDEAWSLADKGNEDWNHAWGAAAGNLIARRVLGLQPLTPGCGRILIQPQLGQSLAYVEGQIPTIRGPVSITISNNSSQYQILATVPGNVLANVTLPAPGAASPVALVDGEIWTGSLSNGWLTVSNIGSGQHAIWLSTNANVSTAALYNNWASSWYGTSVTNAAIAGPNASPAGGSFSNYNAFVTGNDPATTNGIFRIVNVNFIPASGDVAVTVTGNAGRHYTLQSSPSLNPPSWGNVDTQTATNDNQAITLNDSSTASSRQAYLRVMVAYP